ncbi:lipid III flippase WzxE [Pasteurellaceae bacterium USgator11]|nr:lipid III flippase WzxE [Pasteurellaceae bacterium USgator41]TNG94158.1 lipid III flippase WzxE [Pasteurellaceae bacterium UScroc12]TNG99686.1 lipid III flippase WzxE [Pasteurellaceae bacterium UScroc31]TNH01290.1 lipid III flippase WzxE [Pasteurellaceae bacterium USgator11]
MKKSLGSTTIWTASSTLVKILVGLLVIKLLAVAFGTEGVGRAANYMTLLTVLGVFAGGGIFNGVTKYVAEYEQNPTQLQSVLATSSLIIVLFSALVGILLFGLAVPIADFLFAENGYQTVIRVLAVLQFGIALSNYFLAILRGQRNAKANALSIIIGSLLGMLLFLLAQHYLGYQGALIGLALIPALTFLPAIVVLKKSFSLRLFKPQFESQQAKKLLKFSGMVLITAITLPVAYIVMRDRLLEFYSLHDVGLWQGVSKISDAYLQFITAAFSVYLLPTFAKLNDPRQIQHEVGKALKFVLPTVLLVSLAIYLLRELVIRILFSEQFLPMENLFIWQLLGDVFKVSAYVFGYLIVAKAALKLYVLAEISQFILLLGTSYWLIPLNGAVGATQSYLITYFSYFMLCAIGFALYLKRADHPPTPQ